MMSLREASVLVGKNKNYFSVMKILNNEKYSYITSLSNNLVEAYRLYESDYTNTKVEVQYILRLLERNHGMATAFGTYLHKQYPRLFKKPYTVTASTVKYYATVDNIKHSHFLKLKCMVTSWDSFNLDYKETHGDIIAI